VTSQAGPREQLHLEILSPEQIVFAGPVNWVEVPLEDGLFGIWPGHAPLIAALGSGEVRFEREGEVQALQVEGGILRIGIERCAILLGAARSEIERPEVDTERLASELEGALEQALSEGELDALQQSPR
jgi:F-type H+-transporting ATPase subunit epsilon